MTTLAYTLSDSRVMLRRNLKHQLRYPSMTVMLVGMPIVLLLLFVYVFGGQLGAGLGAHEGRARLPRLRGPRAAADHRGLGRPGHLDHGRHGHDRRHHRPVPHDGHRPRLGPHRPRARQPDPNPGRHRHPHRRRLRSRVPLQRRAARLARRDRDPGPVRPRADLAGRRARAWRPRASRPPATPR